MQLKMMEEQKVEKIFIDKARGENVDQKDFKAMMAFVCAGGIVIAESISRIARNTQDLLTIISILTAKSVEFVSEIAKAKGKYKGCKPVAVNEAKFRAVCARWRAGKITATAVMQEVGLKPNTFYRRVKELNF